MNTPPLLTGETSGDFTDLSASFDASSYLTNTSDVVAQLVQAHQTQMHNLITLVNFRARIALYEESQAGREPSALSADARKEFEEPAEELLRYLLLANEAPLDGPIAGTSGFAEEFTARGPRDSQGRSLREFDLNQRLFKYPCSYLIYRQVVRCSAGTCSGIHLSSFAGSAIR